MNDVNFTLEADKIINTIAQVIEDNDVECKYDLDLYDGILTFTNENGTYVINRHSIAKEIWLSSPVSGPYHFFFREAKWQSRSGAELFQVLNQELSILIDKLV